MAHESFRWLAAVIGAHTNKTVLGRLRLQKTMKLLQRIGFPTSYSYSMYHYGPYSEGLQSDLQLLNRAAFISEEREELGNEMVMYKISLAADMKLPDISDFKRAVTLMENSDSTILELAATYLAFREYGLDEDDAKKALRDKKAGKYTDRRFAAALALLNEIEVSGLPEVVSA